MESNQVPSLEEFMEQMSMVWVEEDKKRLASWNYFSKILTGMML